MDNEKNFDDILKNFAAPKIKKPNDAYATCPVCNSPEHLHIAENKNHTGVLIRCVKCGATAEEILPKLGMKEKDLFYNYQNKKTSSKNFSDETEKNKRIHIYLNEDGSIFGRKIICKESSGHKQVWWEKFNPFENLFSKGLGKNKAPLFNLPVLKNAKEIFFCEGEKDCDTLNQMGFIATTLPDGAGGKLSESQIKIFKEKEIIILTDNDIPGKEYGQRILKQLKPVAKKIIKIDPENYYDNCRLGTDVSDAVEDLGLTIIKNNLLKAAERLSRENNKSFLNGVTASDVEARETEFLWYPYIPLRECTVLYSEGGTGKSFFCTELAKIISVGEKFPFQESEERTTVANTLYISAEEDASIISARLESLNADKRRVEIVDIESSLNLNLNDPGCQQNLEKEILRWNARLVIIDPWHAFMPGININNVALVRPIMHTLSIIAKDTNSAIVLISHVRKEAAANNANNATTGSVDLINSSRSALGIIYADEKMETRAIVHTKSNYAKPGLTLIYTISDGRFQWKAIDEKINKYTIEAAARKKLPVYEYSEMKINKEENLKALTSAINNEMEKLTDVKKSLKISYKKLQENYGAEIWAGMQPSKALAAIQNSLEDFGIEIGAVGKVIRVDDHLERGIELHWVTTDEKA